MSRPPDAAMPDAGRVSQRAPLSAGTVGVYLFFAGLLLLTARIASISAFPFINEILAGAFLLFLIRYASTRYWIDADRLRASRLFGSRTVPLEEVRRIEFGNLRDLTPVGLVGTWGWRGRMWSPTLGSFDAIHTVSSGLVISAGAVPLFISPRDPASFARELSRRVRSYTGPLEVDVGAPRGSTGATATG